MRIDRVLGLGATLAVVLGAAAAWQSLPAERAASVTGENAAGVRAFHFVLRRITTERAEWLLGELQQARFNTVQVVVTDGIRLESAPWRPLDDAWSAAEFAAFARSARSKGLTLVPELKLLTHQEKFFQGNHPALMFNRATYDPANPGTYDAVFAVIDEVLELVDPPALHIGHDEVAGHGQTSRDRWLQPGEPLLPAELFLDDVRRIHRYLAERGVETWMWADMLIAPGEFPAMLPRHLHGTPEGYGSALRRQLPRDITLCDWHYADRQPDFPSLSALERDGFRVIGAVWKRAATVENFTRYAAAHGAAGMMMTSWWHVQRQDWDTVQGLIRLGGRTFDEHF